MRPLATLAALVVAVLFVLVAPISGSTQFGPEIWVSPSGNDGATGTADDPLRSIQTAVDAASPGTLVVLSDGSWDENVTIGPEDSGTAGNPVQLIAAPGTKPEIRIDQSRRVEGVRITGSHVIVSGLTVTGVNGSSSNNYGYGILVEGREADNHNIIITGNTVSGFSVGGIAANWTNHVTIDSNRVFGNSNWGPEGGSGISLLEPSNSGGGGATNRITNNVVHENAQLVNSTKIGFNEITDGNCIQLDRLNHGSGAGQDAVVMSNVAYSCGGRGLNIFESDNVWAAQNVTHHNGLTAALSAEVYVEGNNVTLTGNVFVPTEGAQVIVGSPAVDNDNLILEPSATLDDALACIATPEVITDPSIATTTPTTATTRSSSDPETSTSTLSDSDSTTSTSTTTSTTTSIPAGETCPVPPGFGAPVIEDADDDGLLPGPSWLLDGFFILTTTIGFGYLTYLLLKRAGERER